EELGRVGDELRAPEVQVRTVRHRMLAAEPRCQRPGGREERRREGLREVHLVDVARGEVSEDARDGVSVSRRGEQRPEGPAGPAGSAWPPAPPGTRSSATGAQPRMTNGRVSSGTSSRKAPGSRARVARTSSGARRRASGTTAMERRMLWAAP